MTSGKLSLSQNADCSPDSLEHQRHNQRHQHNQHNQHNQRHQRNQRNNTKHNHISNISNISSNKMTGSGESSPLLSNGDNGTGTQATVGADAMEGGLFHNGKDAATAESAEDDVQRFTARLKQLQVVAISLAHLIALVTMVLVVHWAHLMGGFSWKTGEATRVFNWHPVLMITAFAFMTVATLVFRLPMDRPLRKSLHIVSWMVTTLCAVIGILAVFKSHTDRVSGLFPNMWSMHSWIGAIVIVMYLVQFFMGMLTFAVPRQSLTPSYKAKVLLVHKYLGPFIYVGSGVTIMLGIMEQETWTGCDYMVTEPDLTLFEHFNEIPYMCKVSHSIGICVLAMMMCTSFVFHNFGDERKDA